MAFLKQGVHDSVTEPPFAENLKNASLLVTCLFLIKQNANPLIQRRYCSYVHNIKYRLNLILNIVDKSIRINVHNISLLTFVT
jgi:hypothetical protein